MNKGPGLYQCQMCEKGGYIRSAETKEDFVFHMKMAHGVEITVSDLEYLERKAEEAEATERKIEDS